MEDNYYLHECDDNDIVSFGEHLFKINKFNRAVNKSFNASIGSQLTNELQSQGIPINSVVSPFGNYNEYAKWFNEGINCEVLNLGSKTWKKGKVKIKISVEFYAEAQETEQLNNTNQPEITPPESPLDDLRQLLNQNNQQ